MPLGQLPPPGSVGLDPDRIPTLRDVKREVARRGSTAQDERGRVLATQTYNPVGAVSLSSTSLWASAGYTDLDATNAVITFVVPATGRVRLELEACFGAGAAANGVALALREGSTTLTGTGQAVHQAVPSMRHPCTWELSGLTPGVTKTYKIAMGVSSGTGFIFVGGGDTNPNGPLQIRVVAD